MARAFYLVRSGIVRSSLTHSETLSALCGCQVYLKRDFEQVLLLLLLLVLLPHRARSASSNFVAGCNNEDSFRNRLRARGSDFLLRVAACAFLRLCGWPC